MKKFTKFKTLTKTMGESAMCTKTGKNYEENPPKDITKKWKKIDCTNLQFLKNRKQKRKKLNHTHKHKIYTYNFAFIILFLFF